MTTALVALNPELGPPAEVIRFGGGDREALIDAIHTLALDAMFGGQFTAYCLLERVVMALRGARGVDLATDMLLFLEREGLLVIDQTVIDVELPPEVRS